MPKGHEFPAIFERLRSILALHAPPLIIKHDEPGNFYLDTAHRQRNGDPMFFGAVQIKKGHVGYYLMPIYLYPELLESCTPELRKRLQGKSCFHIKALDEVAFAELATLTAAGLARFAVEGLLTGA